MKIKKLYLAHNFYTRKTRRKWELRIESRYNIELDNPFYDNPTREGEMRVLDTYKDKSKEQRDYLSSRDSASIVEDDLEKIRKSDGVIAFANETQVGTLMEIFFAARILRLPVYVLSKKHYHHPWIKEHSERRFTSLKELELFIHKKFGKRRGM